MDKQLDHKINNGSRSPSNHVMIVKVLEDKQSIFRRINRYSRMFGIL